MTTNLSELEPDARSKITLLYQIASDYINSRYRLQSIYKLNKALNVTDEQQKDILAQLALVEKALAILDEDIKKLVSEAEENK